MISSLPGLESIISAQYGWETLKIRIMNIENLSIINLPNFRIRILAVFILMSQSSVYEIDFLKLK